MKFARQEQAYVQRSVRDFACRVAKRERIDGELQEYRYIDMYVREEVRAGGQVVKPLAVFLDVVAPAAEAGRRILYVGGQNENKMLVRKGGTRMSYLILNVDPQGATAKSQCLVPVTETGFSQVLGGMIKILEKQVEADPEGANTLVQHTAKGRMNGRPCSVVRIIHPTRQDELGFYVADVYVDAQLHVPVRVEAYDWPATADESPPLLAEYSYLNLTLNQNPSDAQFERQALRSK